jgi:hypothetical protein
LRGWLIAITRHTFDGGWTVSAAAFLSIRHAMFSALRRLTWRSIAVQRPDLANEDRREKDFVRFATV